MEVDTFQGIESADGREEMVFIEEFRERVARRMDLDVNLSLLSRELGSR